MKLDILHALNAERAARRAVVVVTDVASGEQRLVKAADVAQGSAAETCWKNASAWRKAAWRRRAQGRVFLTVHVPSPQLVITGAVHISQTLAPIGQLLGYDVTIVDPRTAFASIERFPDVKVIAEWPDVALPPLNVDHYTAFVALTHDPKIDDPALKHALARDCFYIGALGSKKTHAKRVQRLKEAGLQRRRHRAHPCADRSRISARCRRPRSPSRSWARSPQRLRHEVGKGGGGMKFGPVAPGDALGATAVHSIRQGDLVLKKGTLIGPAEVAALKAAGVKEIVVARLEPGDVSEDQAAADIAAAVPARACAPTAPSPAAAICSPKPPACWCSTRTRSTGSTASTRR